MALTTCVDVLLQPFRLLKAWLFLSSMGRGINIYGRVVYRGRGRIQIGDCSTLNEGVILGGRGGISIGRHCRISAYSQIQSSGLCLEQHYTDRTHEDKSVTLEDGAWVCAGAIITSGVTLGEGCVVAAGAVVVRDVPAFEMWGGIPAKKIKSLPDGRSEEAEA